MSMNRKSHILPKSIDWHHPVIKNLARSSNDKDAYTQQTSNSTS